MPISSRIHEVDESKSVGLSALVGKLRAQGKKIIGLHVGEPDFPTPIEIVQATAEALTKGETRYSYVLGIPELRKAIAEKLQREQSLPVNTDHIAIGNGSKHILYNIFQMILNQGDEVIVPIPWWVTFPESIKLAGGKPVFVATKNNQLCLQSIETAITTKTKAIIINSPNNPTGAVYPEETLRQLMLLAKKHNLLVVSDEAYEFLTFDNIKFKSPASFSPDAFERTLTVQSFSKSYCMTGFRIGFMAAPIKFIQAFNKLQSHLSGNNCTFSQFGALKAIQMDQAPFLKMRQEFQKRRDLAFELCSEIFECSRPEGAFYLFPNVEKYLGKKFADDVALAEHILKEASVAILPGSAFGAPGFIRFCYSTSEAEFIEGFRRIKEIL